MDVTIDETVNIPGNVFIYTGIICIIQIDWCFLYYTVCIYNKGISVFLFLSIRMFWWSTGRLGVEAEFGMAKPRSFNLRYDDGAPGLIVPTRSGEVERGGGGCQETFGCCCGRSLLV